MDIYALGCVLFEAATGKMYYISKNSGPSQLKYEFVTGQLDIINQPEPN